MTDFHTDYLRTWTEPDPATRAKYIRAMWNPAGRLVVSSQNLVIEGVENISEHIGRVHEDLIATKGLTFTYDQQVTADDALLLRWSMLTPGGDVAGRGVDLVFHDDEGRAQTVYMFMGVE